MAEDIDDYLVLVALPTPGSPVHGIGEEQKHATLLFFGRVAEGSPIIDELVQGARQTAFSGLVAPAKLGIKEISSLGDDGALVWMLDDPEKFLTRIRNSFLADPFIKAEWLKHDQYPDYTPHVTITYEPVPEAADLPQDIVFDRLAVWHGKQQWMFPFEPGSTDAVIFGGSV